MSSFLRLLENEVQIFALSFLVIVYILRILWLQRFKSGRERTFSVGHERSGIIHSMLNIAMPWAMESYRKNPGFYLQFVIFHLGIAAAIGATFIIPYWPEFLRAKIIFWIFRTIIASAFIVGVLRLYRRVAKPAIRLISSWDDYFSLVMLILYFTVSFLALSNDYEKGEWPLILFFSLTAFFLIYVPFSKIGHYLYYPFTRFFLGRTMGHRGFFTKKKNENI